MRYVKIFSNSDCVQCTERDEFVRGILDDHNIRWCVYDVATDIIPQLITLREILNVVDRIKKYPSSLPIIDFGDELVCYDNFTDNDLNSTITKFKEAYGL
jgi:hypothetical protein